MFSLIEDAVRIKTLEILDYCEQNYKGLQTLEGEVDADGNIPGYHLIARRGDVTDFGEDTYFYKIFRRILIQGRFSHEEASRMCKVTDPKTEEGYYIDDMIAFALGATHKKSVAGEGFSLQTYYYVKMSDEEQRLENLPKIDYSEI